MTEKKKSLLKSKKFPEQRSLARWISASVVAFFIWLWVFRFMSNGENRLSQRLFGKSSSGMSNQSYRSCIPRDKQTQWLFPAASLVRTIRLMKRLCYFTQQWSGSGRAEKDSTELWARPQKDHYSDSWPSCGSPGNYSEPFPYALICDNNWRTKVVCFTSKKVLHVFKVWTNQHRKVLKGCRRKALEGLFNPFDVVAQWCHRPFPP